MDDAGSSPPHPPRPLRVVIFPWLAFGHLLPYLELAERLASRGHRVSFVSTPGNVARLPPPRPAEAPRVDLVALSLPRVEGLPDGAESSNSVPDEKLGLLYEAFDGLAAFLAAACADDHRRPDWIIIDSFHHWAAAAALEHKVPWAMLLPSAASLVKTQAAAAAAPRYESPEWNAQFHSDLGGMYMARRFFSTVEGCAFAAMRSCVEWEPEFFPQVAALVHRPVVPLGLLPPSPGGGRHASAAGDGDAAVRWLDVQPPGSVVYVALGSEVPLRAEQVRELALGLELAGARFLWALRKPGGGDDIILPPGFRERTHSRGLVTTGWVPQVSVLAHDAVGGFLTHCGRNSLIEGILFGRPLVMA